MPNIVPIRPAVARTKSHIRFRLAICAARFRFSSRKIFNSLVMELKRKDHTQSKWQPGQEAYLRAAQAAGAYACIALGYEAAIEAVRYWDAQNK